MREGSRVITLGALARRLRGLADRGIRLERVRDDGSGRGDERRGRRLGRRVLGRHVPILLSAREYYSYLAICVDGTIVHGEEPEFEETTDVAAHLDDLLHAIANRPEPGTGLLDALLFGSS
jgi:hypothetical protein